MTREEIENAAIEKGYEIHVEYSDFDGLDVLGWRYWLIAWEPDYIAHDGYHKDNQLEALKIAARKAGVDDGNNR